MNEIENTTKKKKYYREVWKETKKWKKQLLDVWNGLDYYTREEVVKPSLDHKISISYGFKNELNPMIIGNINNLCICSLSTNSKKNYMNDSYFMIKKLKEKINVKDILNQIKNGLLDHKILSSIDKLILLDDKKSSLFCERFFGQLKIVASNF